MPVERTVPPRRSLRSSSPETIMLEDDGCQEELLYPDEPETDISDSTSPPTHTASSPPARRPSHARQQSESHIPRPPNPFICFRMEFCQLNKQLDSEAVRDHRVVSQLAGKAWNALPPAARKKYEDMAREKKELHAQKYPGYSYSPGSSRPGGKGKGKKRKADDDSDYDDRVRQSKRRKSSGARAHHPSLTLVVDADSDGTGYSLSLITSPPEGSPPPPTARSSAPSPEFPRSQMPELSPNSSSSSESSESEPVLRTPALTFSQAAEDDAFVPTSEIPPLDLYATTSEKKDMTIERSKRPSSLYDVGSQFFKADVPSQTRDQCMWYSTDGTYNEPATVAPASSVEELETSPLKPINYAEVQFTNPFELEIMSELIHMDLLH